MQTRTSTATTIVVMMVMMSPHAGISLLTRHMQLLPASFNMLCAMVMAAAMLLALLRALVVLVLMVLLGLALAPLLVLVLVPAPPQLALGRAPPWGLGPKPCCPSAIPTGC